MKGIILAGGSGTRLYPSTYAISKQIIPVYDKPMIYYPLSTLMLAGIKDILIISTERDVPMFETILGDGKKLGISITYKVQARPEGLAQAFILGKEFIANDPVCLILGDNIFYAEGLSGMLKEATQIKEGARIFGYYVNDPNRYGVVEFDKNMKAISIEEKPEVAKSQFAVPGLYFYDNKVVEYAESLKPSKRGELEITDLNLIYLKKNKLDVRLLRRGTAWLDTGTHESLLDASNFVAAIEKRQGLKIACLEEIAYRRNFIDLEQFAAIANSFNDNSYKNYLLTILKQESLKK